MKVEFKDILELVNIKKVVKDFPKIGAIISHIPAQNINAMGTELKLIIIMLARVIKQEYNVHAKTFIYLLFAGVYICMPLDLITDFVPVVGYIDDVALVGYIVKIIASEISRFKETVNMDEINFMDEIKISKETVDKFVESEFFSDVKHTLDSLHSIFDDIHLQIESHDLVAQSIVLSEEYVKKGYQTRTKHLIEVQDDIEIQYVLNNMMFYDGTGQIETDVKHVEKQIIGKVDKHSIEKALNNNEGFLNDNWIEVIFNDKVHKKVKPDNYVLQYKLINGNPRLFSIVETKIVDFNDHILVEQIYGSKVTINKQHLYEIKNNIHNITSHGNVSNVKMIFILRTEYGELIIDYLPMHNHNEVRITASDARDLYFAIDIEKILNDLINNKHVKGA